MSYDKSDKERVFRFKEFEVAHRSAAMKVGTDGVLLGAWADTSSVGCIWDVGTGSGLIALMLAQRCPANIIAIDIVDDAATEAQQNVMASPWHDRIDIVADDVFTCADRLPRPDLIVCNPPFFTESLHAPDIERSIARHEGVLSLSSIIELAARVLTDGGRIAMVGPTVRADDVDWTATLAGLHIRRRVDVRTTMRKDPIRTLWEISRMHGVCEHRVESLRDAAGNWSEWYVALTRDYYTHLN